MHARIPSTPPDVTPIDNATTRISLDGPTSESLGPGNPDIEFHELESTDSEGTVSNIVAEDRHRRLARLRMEIANISGDRLNDAGHRGGGGWSRRRRRLEAWRRCVLCDDPADLPGVPESQETSPPVRSSAPEIAPTNRHSPRSLERDRLETGWVTRDGLEDAGTPPGLPFDDVLDGGLVVDGIHEFLGDGDHPDDAHPPIREEDWIPCLGPVCALLRRLQSRSRRRARAGLRILWVGTKCRPSLPATCDVDDVTLARSGLLLHGPQSASERRWCIEQAIRTGGLDAVVADARDFTLIDTRRLQVALAVRSESGDPPISVFLVRPLRELALRSATTTRWLVQPEPGLRGFETTAWRVRLHRTRMPQTIRRRAGDPERPMARVDFDDMQPLMRPTPTGPADFPSGPETTDALDRRGSRERLCGADASSSDRVVETTDRGDRPSDVRLGPRPGTVASKTSRSPRAREPRTSRDRLHRTRGTTRGQELLFPVS